jgi:hypothetical protein
MLVHRLSLCLTAARLQAWQDTVIAVCLLHMLFRKPVETFLLCPLSYKLIGSQFFSVNHCCVGVYAPLSPLLSFVKCLEC